MSKSMSCLLPLVMLTLEGRRDSRSTRALESFVGVVSGLLAWGTGTLSAPAPPLLYRRERRPFLFFSVRCAGFYSSEGAFVCLPVSTPGTYALSKLPERASKCRSLSVMFRRIGSNSIISKLPERASGLLSCFSSHSECKLGIISFANISLDLILFRRYGGGWYSK